MGAHFFAIVVTLSVVVLIFFVLRGRYRVIREIFDEDKSKIFVAIISGVVTFGYGYYRDVDTASGKAREDAVKHLEDSARSLASKEIIERVAAVHALEQILGLDEKFHRSVTRVLSIFIRNSSQLPDPTNIAFDIQAAIDVLGHRPREMDDPLRVIDVSGSRLYRPNFHGLPGFSGAIFNGATLYAPDMRYSDFSGTDFRGARMGDVTSYEHLNAGAKWSSAMAEDDQYKNWGRFMYVANFESANLRNAGFDGADLRGANFKGADLKGASFLGAHLARADLCGARNINPQHFKWACGVAVACSKEAGVSLEPCD